MKSYINFGNDWVAGAPRGLQHRCPRDKRGGEFDSHSFPQKIKHLKGKK